MTVKLPECSKKQLPVCVCVCVCVCVRALSLKLMGLEGIEGKAESGLRDNYDNYCASRSGGVAETPQVMLISTKHHRCQKVEQNNQ